mmetsp:Transcript_7962/g.22381  ORF Transcript_7962/g.22381 Transcript_7962/m.22381 type:complete len:463 (+) Transcript_7962:132-1520(+)
MRRISIALHSRKNEVSRQMSQLAVYCRKTELLEHLTHSSRSYITSVDQESGQESLLVPSLNAAVDMAIASASEDSGIDAGLLRPGFERSPQRTNADSMLQFLVPPELQGSLFANHQFVWQQSRIILNGTEEYETNVQRIRSQGGPMATMRAPGLAASRSRLQSIKLARETIEDIISLRSFKTHSSIYLLRSISLQLPLSLSETSSRRAVQQALILTSTSSDEYKQQLNGNSKAGPTPVHARETVKAVAHEVMGTHIDENAPLMSAGLDSIAAIEFVNTLSERLCLKIEHTALFDHPTLNSLAGFLSSEIAINDEATTSPREEKQSVAEVSVLETREERTITIAAWDFSVAGGITTASELRSLTMRALTVNTNVPVDRWTTPTPGAGHSAAYGSFLSPDQLGLDHGAFGISLAEARSMDPQQSLVLSVGYGALIKGSNSTVSRSAFTNSNIGVFVGVEPSGLE